MLVVVVVGVADVEVLVLLGVVVVEVLVPGTTLNVCVSELVCPFASITVNVTWCAEATGTCS